MLRQGLCGALSPIDFFSFSHSPSLFPPRPLTTRLDSARRLVGRLVRYNTKQSNMRFIFTLLTKRVGARMGHATAGPAQLAHCHRSLSTVVEPLFAERFPILALAFWPLIPFQSRPRNRLHYEVHITNLTGPVPQQLGARQPCACPYGKIWYSTYVHRMNVTSRGEVEGRQTQYARLPTVQRIEKKCFRGGQ